MKRVCKTCDKEFSTTIKFGEETIYSIDRVRCLDCFPFKKRTVEFENKEDNLRNIQLRCKYGIGLKDYEGMLKNQGGTCAICGCPPPNSYKKRLSVDHDHETEKVRGLLCTKCNVMLGWYEKHDKKIVSYLTEQKVPN